MIINDLSKQANQSKPIGALCPNCGGDLLVAPLKVSTDRIIKALSFGMLHVRMYRCHNCKRKFKLI
jgi:DNA-directed RNA polymerase subunit RPC12/RpoP